METILGYLINILTFGWKNRREADIKLFERLYSELNFHSGSAALLREHDFSNAFQFDHLQTLTHTSEDWSYADAKFHSWLIERRKSKFLKDLVFFLDQLSLHTAIEDGDLMSIGLHDANEGEIKHKKKAAETINRLSTKAYKSYEKFVKSYKKQLNA